VLEATAPTAPAPVPVAAAGAASPDDGTTTLVQDPLDGTDSATTGSAPASRSDVSGSSLVSHGERGDDSVGGHIAAELSAVGVLTRATTERAPASATNVLQAGPVVTKVPSGSLAADAESAPTPGGAVTSDVGPVLSEDVPAAAEFPDSATAKAGGRVDIDDLATSISRPLAAGNGEYSVLVSLHPPELGEVRALLSLQGDVLHVTLTPEHAGGFDALAEALPTLHDQLGGGGVEVNVTLGQPGDTPGGDGGASEPGPGDKTPSGATTPSAAPMVPITAGSPGRIHLVL
jgi:Flagellar hook-length control protein FliK